LAAGGGVVADWVAELLVDCANANGIIIAVVTAKRPSIVFRVGFVIGIDSSGEG
jgi:thioester reductase-like protein